MCEIDRSISAPVPPTEFSRASKHPIRIYPTIPSHLVTFDPNFIDFHHHLLSVQDHRAKAYPPPPPPPHEYSPSRYSHPNLCTSVSITRVWISISLQGDSWVDLRDRPLSFPRSDLPELALSIPLPTTTYYYSYYSYYIHPLPSHLCAVLPSPAPPPLRLGPYPIRLLSTPSRPEVILLPAGRHRVYTLCF